MRVSRKRGRGGREGAFLPVGVGHKCVSSAKALLIVRGLAALMPPQRTADANVQTRSKIGPKNRKKRGAYEGSARARATTCAAICDPPD